MEYRSRTFRIDDEVWEAIQKHELSANKLLRTVLGLDRAIVTATSSDNPPRTQIYVQGDDKVAQLDAIGPELSSGRGKVATETFARGPRQKGDKTR